MNPSACATMMEAQKLLDPTRDGACRSRRTFQAASYWSKSFIPAFCRAKIAPSIRALGFRRNSFEMLCMLGI
jgi:hypothetical protein